MKKILASFILLIIFVFIYSMIFENDYDYIYVNYLQRTGALPLRNNDMPLAWNNVNAAYNTSNASENERIIFDYIKRFHKETSMPRINGYVQGSYVNNYGISINSRISLSAYIGDIYCMSELTSRYPYGDSTYLKYISEKEWNNSASRISKAVIAYSSNNFTAVAGRFLPAMGRGIFDNMFLSSKILPPDGLYFSYNRNGWDFAFYAATLTPGYRDFINDSTRKYISLHKIGLSLPYKTYISFKELIIYRTLMPQLRYMNPFTLYYGIQWNTHSDDNVVWSVELINRYFAGLTISGELFVDDFVYEKELSAIFDDFQLYAPDKTGFVLSLSYAPPTIDGLLVEGEYARVSKYTGTHRFPVNAYSYYNEPALYFIGPDADLAGIKLSYFINTMFNIMWTNTYTRKGEGRITDAFIEMSGQDYDYEFPSGIVIHNLNTDISLHYRYKIFSIYLNGGCEFVKNRDNLETDYWDVTPYGSITGEVRI